MDLANNFLIPIALVLGSGIVVLLGIYNVIAGILFLRERIDGRAGFLAKAAWALSGISLGMWCMPCLGTVAALTAVVFARIERGRIYASKAPLASATPVRMARINARWSLVLQAVVYSVIVIGEVMKLVVVSEV
ncbi:MAG: hypothetical protein AAGA48_10860 [Myxococcota bacterium]